MARAAAIALDGEVPGGATLLGDGRRTTIGGACLGEQNVPPEAFDLIERFVDRLPDGSLDDVLQSFRMLEPGRG